ncbi:MAG: flagellar export chaperone FliS [Thiomonas sp.]|uniref:Putative Flagellar protein FliS n=1 Tax=mine drainage metagenome TaxID=410659 RepID=E6PMC8_9ZZZZ
MSAGLAVQAYRQVGQQGVPEDKLLVLGLDGILEYLRRARVAIADSATDRKLLALNKSYQIVEHLLVALPGAPEVTPLGHRLEGIYRYLLERLGQANIFDDVQAIDDCDAVVTALRDSWLEGLRRG